MATVSAGPAAGNGSAAGPPSITSGAAGASKRKKSADGRQASKAGSGAGKGKNKGGKNRKGGKGGEEEESLIQVNTNVLLFKFGAERDSERERTGHSSKDREATREIKR